MNALTFILSLSLLIFQTDRTEFQLLNSSEESLKIEIPGFRSLILHPEHPSEFRVQTGQEIYLLKDIDADDELDRVLLFVVAKEHEGKVIKVDKLVKQAIKDHIKVN